MATCTTGAIITSGSKIATLIVADEGQDAQFGLLTGQYAVITFGDNRIASLVDSLDDESSTTFNRLGEVH
jgi:hypothetical protein